MPDFKPGDRVRFAERTEIDTPKMTVTVPPTEVLTVLEFTPTMPATETTKEQPARVKLMLGEAAVWISQKFVTREG